MNAEKNILVYVGWQGLENPHCFKSFFQPRRAQSVHKGNMLFIKYLCSLRKFFVNFCGKDF